MKKLQETEYMYGTARIRALENHIVGRERLAALIDTRSIGEVWTRLSEFGVSTTDAGENSRRTDGASAERLLLDILRKAYRDVEEAAPAKEVFTWFRYPYDCNNIKMALKCHIRQMPAEETADMMFDFGTVSVDAVLNAVRDSDFRAFPPAMAAAAAKAEESFSKNGDPQLIDALLDKACYADMLSCVSASGDDTMLSWVKTKIDLVNAMICLRILRMNRGDTGRMFLENSLLSGGYLSPSFFLGIYTDAAGAGESAYWEAMAVSRYAAFAKAAEATSGSLSAVEKCADDCWMTLVRETSRVSFGAPAMGGYLVGCETAVKNIRILLAAKEAGLDAAVIRERVRESYV